MAAKLSRREWAVWLVMWIEELGNTRELGPFDSKAYHGKSAVAACG